MSVWSYLKKIFSGTNTNTTRNTIITKNDDITVYDCMIPNKELCFVHIQTSFPELLTKMQNSKNPYYVFVYDNTSDDLIGIVYEKDIITTFQQEKKKDGCDFYFSNIFFAPYVMDISTAVKLLHKKNTNLLVVVDNRGGTLGIVTKASIIDFVYGYETNKEYFLKNAQDNNIIVEGTLLLKHIPDNWYIEEFHQCYKSGTRTIAGFLGYYTGMVLQVDSIITINYMQFKILEGNEKVVNKILMTKINN